VSKSSIPNQINDYISSKFLSKLSSSSENFSNIIYAITINMEYWSIYAFCNISAVLTWSRFMRSSCEPNLIVNNYMNRATYTIIDQILHLHWFIYNSLPCKCSISMNNDWAHFISILISHKVLFSSCSSHNYWINCL
jgi:hypothetical protein